MPSKLYVGNLSYQMRDEDLEQLFSQFGQVDSARIITDRDSGRSKGFGFVEMGSDDDATKAINELNGKEVEGRAMRVDRAQERQGGGGGRGGRGGPGGGGGRGPRGPRR